ncbi:MAG: hypothetical protein A2X54_01130 [Nitrospirae bacterium GWF2_44_13]|nr:MAG: hypothetical protein A2X54_01130 [Nitrospirae bacterium GWF2_44_13]OGW34187.1 MAG: hypothetical protein A2088_04175 [Nitrospirae bacterium GWD2_44_7]OGW66410.1 MAG: hypothetical protein A2222_08610 [Nitrospirae bacterium RIFOXYA2_FULL_44_9]OGW73405.1 MAG: hypothetical protein A2484_02935 [Nitrospirae bacterium RIFOXYC2_FULL_44_7]HBG93705.1 hypothetical protein [Nitrospiraceae bacterium]
MSDNIFQILEYVKEQRVVDFSAYRLDTIKRRLALRLHSTEVPDYRFYLQSLKENGLRRFT